MDGDYPPGPWEETPASTIAVLRGALEAGLSRLRDRMPAAVSLRALTEEAYWALRAAALQRAARDRVTVPDAALSIFLDCLGRLGNEDAGLVARIEALRAQTRLF